MGILILILLFAGKGLSDPFNLSFKASFFQDLTANY
jgi:hypothetical protein